MPVAAVAVVCPALAGFILACRRGGLPNGCALLIRAFDVGRIGAKAIWLPILLISPAVGIVAFVIMRLGGSRIPDPQIALPNVLALSAVFLVSGLSEELGWSAYALDPLQARSSALAAGLLIGAVWAIWRYPALVQAHRSVVWIGWWTLGTVSMRIIMVWLFNRTGGSMFGAAVFHAVSNLCWQLFPVQGSWFDPRLHGLLMAAVALVLVLWYPGRGQVDRTLALARLGPS
ncbi:CPBP family intramembrane glutamic endopeptidase [Phenylobacterium sp.]|uniref:CPBP family intramembrane glutamic endopeptidase n=1 Tax=Phenylobacterium sp. TaxID=1871053 RepID=UPI0025F1D99A|nr:CPBP family intramembrane glutamic endopeptidase [Phenylobacterium sp.]